MSVSWGIISTARINRKFLAGARSAADVDVVAVASRSIDAAQAYARENGIDRAYGSYEALLEDTSIEAVYVSLPNSMHVEWSVRALEAGKHVLCEKPLSRRADEVLRAFAVAETQRRLLMEAFMWRHHPQTARLVSLVRHGAVGRLRLIRGAFSFALAEPGDVRLDPALDGGALMDVGCYCVSAARLLAGEPVAVSAFSLTGGGGVDTVMAASMRFGDDVLAGIDCGLALTPRDELEVVGDEGSLFVGDPWHCVSPGIELRRAGGGNELISVTDADSYALQAQNFSRAIRGTAAPLLGRDDALGQARTIEALYEAAESGRVVALGPG